MIYVALAEAAVLAVACLSFTGIIRWQIRQAARERELLVNQVCALAGRPWQEPPAMVYEPEREPELLYAATPEQLP